MWVSSVDTMNAGAVKWVALCTGGVAILVVLFVSNRTRNSAELNSTRAHDLKANTFLISNRHWHVSRKDLKAYLVDPERLNKDVRLNPTMGKDADSITALHIARLTPDSPLYTAGFRKDDRIVSINGTPVTTLSRALNLVHEIESCSRLKVQVERDGKTVDYEFEFE